MLVQDEAQSGWQNDVVRELYEALVAQSLPLRETFELFDPHSSGKVTGSGFREVRTKNGIFFECFPYVCPEPVLAK